MFYYSQYRSTYTKLFESGMVKIMKATWKVAVRVRDHEIKAWDITFETILVPKWPVLPVVLGKYYGKWNLI